MTTTDPEPLLEGLHLERRFGHGDRERRVLRDVSVSVRPGECLGIIGGSGSGKTTLVRILLGLQGRTFGIVRYRGHGVDGRRSGGYRLLRAESALVFQDPFTSLDPRWTVGRIVAEPLVLRRCAGRSPVHKIAEWCTGGLGRMHSGDAGRRDAVLRALTQAGLDALVMLERRPSQLSGGQAQRVAIARALVTQPRLIVADEPMSAIDVSARLQVMRTLAAIRTIQPDAAVVIVSHDLGVVQHLADDVLVLHDGAVVEQGPTARMLRDPQHPYTRELIRAASW